MPHYSGGKQYNRLKRDMCSCNHVFFASILNIFNSKNDCVLFCNEQSFLGTKENGYSSGFRQGQRSKLLENYPGTPERGPVRGQHPFCPFLGETKGGHKCSSKTMADFVTKAK